jgi:hypothetical protein
MTDMQELKKLQQAAAKKTYTPKNPPRDVRKQKAQAEAKARKAKAAKDAAARRRNATARGNNKAY